MAVLYFTLPVPWHWYCASWLSSMAYLLMVSVTLVLFLSWTVKMSVIRPTEMVWWSLFDYQPQPNRLKYTVVDGRPAQCKSVMYHHPLKSKWAPRPEKARLTNIQSFASLTPMVSFGRNHHGSANKGFLFEVELWRYFRKCNEMKMLLLICILNYATFVFW